MDIEKAFDILTGNTNDLDKGQIRGTTKKEVRDLCGDDWDEKAWLRMVSASNRLRNRIIGDLPFYDNKLKLWFWY